MGRILGKPGGRRVVAFDVVPATTSRFVDLDVSKYAKGFVVVACAGAGAAGDIISSVDLLAPDGTPYVADTMPGQQPTPPNTVATSSYYNPSTLNAKSFAFDCGALSTVRVRYRNTTAGALVVQVDAWGV